VLSGATVVRYELSGATVVRYDLSGSCPVRLFGVVRSMSCGTVVRSMSGATVVRYMSGATCPVHFRCMESSTVTRRWFLGGVFHVVTLNSRTFRRQYHVSACHVNLAVYIIAVTCVLQSVHLRPIR
jgi:hypothetical protein